MGMFPQVNLGQSLQSGLKTGATMRALYDKSEANAQAAAATEQYKTDLQDALQNPNPKKMAELYAKYPNQITGIEKTFGVMDDAKKKRLTSVAQQAYAAMNSGKPDIAKAVIEKNIASFKAQGLDTTELGEMRDIMEKDDKTAHGLLGLITPYLMGPKEFAKNSEAMNPAPPKKQSAYGKWCADSNLDPTSPECKKKYKEFKMSVDDASTTRIRNYNKMKAEHDAKGEPFKSFEQYNKEQDDIKLMGMGRKDVRGTQANTRALASYLNVKPSELSSINVDNLTPEQNNKFREVVEDREMVLKNKMSDSVKKKMNEVGRLVFSAKQVSGAISENDTGMLDSLLQNVNQYLGLGDDVVRSMKVRGSYNDFRNSMLKIMSGAAVSTSEADRFTQGFGALYQSDKTAATKFRTQLMGLEAELRTIKNAYDPVAFNYRYGNLHRGVKNAIGKMTEAISDEGKNSTLEELRAEKATKRVPTFEEAKARYPSLTIEDYQKRTGAQ